MSVNNNIQTASEHRTVDRNPAELQTIVQVKESHDEMWKEVTKVLTVSKNGAGFYLTRPCVVGRLVTLVMPLDPELRAYDKSKELYPVMAIVQYCNASTVDGKTQYHVGVGFVGKNIPESFKSDPTQSYRISGMKQDGLWSVSEAQSQFKNRKQPRYWFALPVTVSLLQRADKSVSREDCFTKNIAAGGVSVSCSLDAEVGEKVKIACKDFNFYSVAMVRNRKMSSNEIPTLHLEFIDNEFPIEELVESRVAAVAAV
jgi:PilZ domain